jgi:hypothetical protein
MDFLDFRAWHNLIVYYRAAHCNTIVTAIATQAKATYGDRRSPGKICVSKHKTRSVGRGYLFSQI